MHTNISKIEENKKNNQKSYYYGVQGQITTTLYPNLGFSRAFN